MTTKRAIGAGPNGAAVTTSNATSGDQWDFISALTGTASITYSNAHPTHGNTTGYKFSYGPGFATLYCGWKSSLVASNKAYAWTYFYLTAYPPNDLKLMSILSVGALAASLTITSDGKLHAAGANADFGISVSPLPLNQWIRVDFQITNVTQIWADLLGHLYLSAESTTPTETYSGTHFVVSGTDPAVFDEVRYGIYALANMASLTEVWVGDSAYSDTGMPALPSSGGSSGTRPITTGQLWPRGGDSPPPASVGPAAPAPVTCRVIRTGSQSIDDTTDIQVTFNSVLEDPLNFLATSPGQTLTVPAGCAGLYMITGGLYYAPATGGARIAKITVNSTQKSFSSSAGASIDINGNGVSTSVLTRLAVGDIVQLTARQTSGSPLNVSGTTGMGIHLELCRVAL